MTARLHKFLNGNDRRQAGRGWLRYAGCVVLAIGCASGCNKLASVGGVVRLDGKPVANAGVVFHSTAGKGVASSSTDADGYYQLNSGGQVGVPPGEYRVTVIKDEIAGSGNAIGLAGPGGVQVKHAIPARYNDIANSPLLVTVMSGRQTHDLDLSTNPKADEHPSR